MAKETVIKASDILPGAAGRTRGEKNPLGRVPAWRPRTLLSQIQDKGSVRLTAADLHAQLQAHAKQAEGIRLSGAKRNGVTPEVALALAKARLPQGVRQAVIAFNKANETDLRVASSTGEVDGVPFIEFNVVEDEADED